MFVVPEDKVTSVNVVQFAKHAIYMVVTVPGMVMLVTGVPFKYNVLVPSSIQPLDDIPNENPHHHPMSLM